MNKLLYIVGAFILAVAMLKFAVNISNRQSRIDKCVVAEYENNTGKDRRDMYNYCQAKANRK